jgi:hypothetical protein
MAGLAGRLVLSSQPADSRLPRLSSAMHRQVALHMGEHEKASARDV